MLQHVSPQLIRAFSCQARNNKSTDTAFSSR